MVPFSDGVTYNTERLLFALVDDDNQGHVSEYSEGFDQFLLA
jgi:hypothetical protein